MLDDAEELDAETDEPDASRDRYPWARRNVMLTIAYDGTNYQGWQVQPNGLSVQECVETAVERLTGDRPRVLCAGRTDAGVHALGQVANFPTNSRVPITNIRRGLQTFLPEDIVIVSAKDVSKAFHSTYSAVRKRYRYVIHDGDVCPPFLKPFVHRSQHQLDVERMSKAATWLLGTHDFRCFEKHFPNKSTSVRTIMDVSVSRHSCWMPWTSLHNWSPIHGSRHDQPDLPLVIFEVMADGFLYNMVRAIVGTLMEIGRGKQSPESLQDVILSLDRAEAGMTAMPNGLYLVSVDYPEASMGIYDRNYFRGSSGGWGSGPGSWPPVCKAIVFINIGVFMAQLLITRPPTIEEVRDSSYGIETEYDFVEAYVENRRNGGDSDEDFIDNIAQRRLIEMLLQTNGKRPRKTSKESEKAKADSESNPPADNEAEKRDAADNNAAAAESGAAESETPASESTSTTTATAVADNTPAIKTDNTDKSKSTPDADEISDEELRQEAELAYHEYLADHVAFSPRVSVVQQWLELDSDKVMKGQIWRILTSAFCHDRHGLFHILFNMLGLIWFGIALEYMYGQREFLLFYLTAGILSGLAYVGLDLWTGDSVPAIGASGAVMGVLMLFACHYPHYTIRIWFFFPIEMRWLVLLYVAFDLHPLLLQLAGDEVHSGVAHAAHLGGLAFGFVYWNQRLRLAPIVDSLQKFDLAKSWRRKFNSPNLKLHTSSENDGKSYGAASNDNDSLDQNRVDELLTKITEVGRDRLTEEELAILRQASERMRQKRK